ncbi:unnamed protein product [Pleuronectes platessa]|uniref:HECT domain-containing protein n=1 Tax=Pleuronectes platessa TaxID=8262 RepID=A0A9N7UU63_PLEPL|nr:unnamed protein product [Pleuronectes platessa]
MKWLIDRDYLLELRKLLMPLCSSWYALHKHSSTSEHASGSTDTAAAALTLQDCPDLDHRETIGFVLRRVKQPIKQIRKGLKETGIWPLLSERPDVHPLFFPREANEVLDSQTVIQHIVWPQPSCYSDEDEDDPVPLEKVSLITGFLRKFIEEASQEVLRDLMKFWVGWEQLTKSLVVEVVTSTYPVALTCFLKLKFPSHYQTYTMFHRDLMMALSSISSGFGLV